MSIRKFEDKICTQYMEIVGANPISDFFYGTHTRTIQWVFFLPITIDSSL